MREVRAFTLVEVLTVVGIVGVLAAILSPVYASAKERSNDAVCTSHLHQAAMATVMYAEGHDGRYPAGRFNGKFIHVTPNESGRATGVFRCPLDGPQGRPGLPPADRTEPLSYARTWYLWEGEEGARAWDRLLQIETNPILLRCAFHVAHQRRIIGDGPHVLGQMDSGREIVARKDGSVGWDTRPFSPRWEYPRDLKSAIWRLATKEPCPSDVCDGGPVPEGWRGGM